MSRKKPHIKRITKEKDIDNLKIKDVVEIDGYGPMRYNGKLYGNMVFLGRFTYQKHSAIIEFGCGRDQLFSSPSGIIRDRAKECWEHYYWSGKNTPTNPREYNSKNKKLLEVGLWASKK